MSVLEKPRWHVRDRELEELHAELRTARALGKSHLCALERATSLAFDWGYGEPKAKELLTALFEGKPSC